MPPEPPGSDEVRAAIEDAAETRNADDCARLATPRYLRQYERRGRSALAACQKGVFERDRGLLASDVRVQVLRVNRFAATALVTHRERGYAGITARLRLTREAKGRWVLNRVTGFTRATRRQMNRALASEIADGPVPFGGRAARCAVRSLNGRSDRELESFLLEARPGALFAPVAGCDRRAFVGALVGEIREAGANIRPEFEACFERDLANEPTGRLVRILVEIEETGDYAVGAGCPKGLLPGADGT